MNPEETSPHPILASPWTYKIVRIDWQLAQEEARSSHLDLTFAKPGEVRRLRFLFPTRIKVDEGFCGHCSGLLILDIRQRQWDDAKIEVVNFEQDPGITFLAAEVVDLDLP